MSAGLARPTGRAADRSAVLVLAGHSWAIVHIDWARRIVQVEPTDAPGLARWSGNAQPLAPSSPAQSAKSCSGPTRQASPPASEPASGWNSFAPNTNGYGRTPPPSSSIVGGVPAGGPSPAGEPTSGSPKPSPTLRRVSAVDDLTVALDPETTVEQLGQAISAATLEPADMAPWVTDDAIDGLKFSDCLPRSLATTVLARRLADPESTARALGERIAGWRDAT